VALRRAINFADGPKTGAQGLYFYGRNLLCTGDAGLIHYKDENGDVFHTYSTYGRGLDILVGAYNFLDLVPKGRDENPDSTMDWVRRHDDYDVSK
jgi:predicted dithiol-disulfide oxidoreductase (DUF899 family)